MEYKLAVLTTILDSPSLLMMKSSREWFNKLYLSVPRELNSKMEIEITKTHKMKNPSNYLFLTKVNEVNYTIRRVSQDEKDLR